MKTKNIVKVVLCSLIIGALIFVVVWAVGNFGVVKQAMSGTNIYTYEDIEKAYEDGYNTALADKEEYVKLIEQYRDDLTELQATVKALNVDLAEAQALYGKQSAEVEELQKTLEQKNQKITKLEQSIKEYEQFVEEVEKANTVVAKFMVGETVYALQSYTKGETVSVEAPESTETATFNGWLVNGSAVEIPGYVINQSTTFIADMTYSIAFMVDDVVYNTQEISTGETLTLPEEPTKTGYTFIGWSIDGENVVEIDIDNVVNPVTYNAVFEITYHQVEILGESADNVINVKALNSTFEVGQELYYNGAKATVTAYDEGGECYELSLDSAQRDMWVNRVGYVINATEIATDVYDVYYALYISVQGATDNVYYDLSCNKVVFTEEDRTATFTYESVNAGIEVESVTAMVAQGELIVPYNEITITIKPVFTISNTFYKITVTLDESVDVSTLTDYYKPYIVITIVQV